MGDLESVQFKCYNPINCLIKRSDGQISLKIARDEFSDIVVAESLAKKGDKAFIISRRAPKDIASSIVMPNPSAIVGK